MRDVEFLFELGTLRHIQRTWRQFGGVPYANVAEHTVRVAWIAMMLAAHEGADIEHVATLALLHDIPETRTGDVNYVSRQYVARSEAMAIHDMVQEVSRGAQILEGWKELQEVQTLEAKLVKDADALDCDFELAELDGTGGSLLEALRRSREEVFKRLHTQSARSMFHEIYSSDPHAWHVRGRNRLTAGDWRPQP